MRLFYQVLPLLLFSFFILVVTVFLQMLVDRAGHKTMIIRCDILGPVLVLEQWRPMSWITFHPTSIWSHGGSRIRWFETDVIMREIHFCLNKASSALLFEWWNCVHMCILVDGGQWGENWCVREIRVLYSHTTVEGFGMLRKESQCCLSSAFWVCLRILW